MVTKDFKICLKKIVKKMGGSVTKHVSKKGVEYFRRNGKYNEYNRIPEDQDPHGPDPVIAEILERGTYQASDLAEMFPRLLLENEELRVGDTKCIFYIIAKLLFIDKN